MRMIMNTARAYDTLLIKKAEGMVNFNRYKENISIGENAPYCDVSKECNVTVGRCYTGNDLIAIALRNMHASLIKWFLGSQVATVGVILTFLKFFH